MGQREWRCDQSGQLRSREEWQPPSSLTRWESRKRGEESSSCFIKEDKARLLSKLKRWSSAPELDLT
ncbi:hypothetical protein NL676_011273 [Syzygium grande]|nr:hypothetical protein NL676_011273 [Syzygium grande]